MAQILVSTGSLIGRPNGRDYTLLQPLSKDLLCDGYEFMMYSSWYEQIERLTDFLTSSELIFPVYHCEKGIGEDISRGGECLQQAFARFEMNAKMAKDIGAEKMVIHLWDGMTSDSHIQENIKAFKTVREIADKYGRDLLVENVVCNVQDPMTHWIQLYEKYSDVHFIFDTKMAAFHSQLDLIYKEEYRWLWTENHIKHLHVNDYAGGHMDWANLRTLPIGAGTVDFDSFFAFIKKQGYDGTFTLESTAFDNTGSVNTEMLNHQICYIRNQYE